MDDLTARLEKCFATVFPTLSRDEIRNARIETVGDWDSMRSVTLLAVVEEEFGVPLDLDHLEKFSSFGGIRELLGNQAANG